MYVHVDRCEACTGTVDLYHQHILIFTGDAPWPPMVEHKVDGMCAHLHLCFHDDIHLYIHIYMYIYIHLYSHIYTHNYINIYTYLYISVYIIMYVYTEICARIDVCTCAFIHTHMHI